MINLIKSMVDNRYYDIVMHVITIISIISFSIATLPDISHDNITILASIETYIIIIFSIDYILQSWAVGFKYNKSFQGMLDLLIILPFYISSLNTTALRVFKLIRLFKLFKIPRCEKAILLLKKAFISIREDLLIFTILMVMFMFIISVGIYYAEHDAQPEMFASIFHSFWWAIITLTTVGYGDMTPITLSGKMFTGCILFMGLAIIAIPTSLFSAALIEARKDSC